MSEGIKVHDKRMFTPDGELREEYRDLESDEAKEETEESAPQESDERSERGTPDGRRIADPRESAASAAGGTAAAEPGRSSVEMPDIDETDAVGFLDLVAVIAEPIALYLGDAQLPDGRSMENLEMARLHIDLLDVLKEKTEGNLTAEERSVLDDILYRLRMRYVQKRG